MYATASDMRRHRPERDLVQLTDPDLAEIDDARIDAALAAASAEIDGYLGGRYPVPMDPAPRVLRFACVDIAFYRLHVAVSPSVDEALKGQYQTWIRFLSQVARGDADLARPSGSNEPAMEPSDVLSDGGAQTFSRKSLRGF